jgi:HEAT repeat protein
VVVLIDHDSLLELFYKLYNPDKEIMASARQYLHDNEEPILSSLEVLLGQALKDGIIQDQSISILVLGEMSSSTKLVDILLATWRDERFHQPDQVLLINALAKSNDERVLPILLEIIGGHNNYAWRSAQDGLSRLGEVAIPRIVEFFHNGDTNIRRGAVERLGFYPLHPLALPTLLEATHDTDTVIRSEAASGLSRFRYPEALIELLELLHDSDDQVRKQAYKSLIITDPYTALTTYMQLLKDADLTIREEVAEMLISKPISYFGLGGWLGQQNLMQFYKDAPGFRDIEGLASESDIKALLSNTEVIYGTHRVCDIANTALKAINTPIAKALLSVGQ